MGNIVLGIMLRATDDASKVFDQLNAESKKLSKGILQHSKAIGMGMTAVGGATTAAYGLAAKSFSDFDAGMRKVNSMLLLSQDEFKALSTDVREMAQRIGIDATNATEGLYQAISAGVPEENAIEFLEVASKAAIAGVTDTETAVDGLTTAMNAFKIPVSEAQGVADMFFQTVKSGKTTFPELSSYMAQVAPVAASMGVELKDVLAATATLTKQGTPTSQAMTQIRQSLVSLTKPSEDMKKLLADMGYESGEAAIEALGYAGTMEALSIAAKGNNEVIAKAIGSVEGLQAVLGVTGKNASMAAQDLRNMDQATDGLGAATDAFNIINEGAGRRWEDMMATLNEVTLTVGEAIIPTLMDMMGVVKEVTGWVINWMNENPVLSKTLIIIGGAVGAVLAVLGPFVIILPQLVLGIKMVGTVLTVLKMKMIAFGATVTTTTGIIGILAAVIAGVVLAMQAWKKEEQELNTFIGYEQLSLDTLIKMRDQYAMQIQDEKEGTAEYIAVLEDLKEVDQAITAMKADQSLAQEAVADATARATGEMEEQILREAEQAAALAEATGEVKDYELALQMAQDDLRDAQEAFAATTDEVAALEDELRAAKQALENLKAPRLEGSQEFEDEMFRIQHNVNQLKLAMMDEKMNITLQMRDSQGNITDQIIPAEKFEETMENLKQLGERTELKWTVDTESAMYNIREAAEQALGENKEITAEAALGDIESLAAKIAPGSELQMNLADLKLQLDLQEESIKIKKDVVTAMEEMVKESKTRLKNLKTEFGEASEEIVGDANRAANAWKRVLNARLAAERAEESGITPSMDTGGIVPGRPGEPVHIIAHGGEVFGGVGAHQLNSGPTVVHNNITVKVGEDEITSIIEEKIGQKITGQGL